MRSTYKVFGIDEMKGLCVLDELTYDKKTFVVDSIMIDYKAGEKIITLNELGTEK